MRAAVQAVGGLTGRGEELFRESREVKPDPFGDLLAALAALPKDTARLALVCEKIYGDEEIVLWVARSWAITKRDLDANPSRIEPFFSVAETTEASAPLDRARAKIVVSCLYVLQKAVLAENQRFDGQMERIERAAIRFAGDPGVRETAGLTLFLLKERAWLSADGERALEAVYEADPNLRARYPNHQRVLVTNFEANIKG
jgi:hypothetical protein